MRENGYYWIKQGDDWDILFWDGAQWTNNDTYFDAKDEDFEEIGERVPSNEEIKGMKGTAL